MMIKIKNKGWSGFMSILGSIIGGIMGLLYEPMEKLFNTNGLIPSLWLSKK